VATTADVSSGWSEGTFVADTSAWARASHAADAWNSAIAEDRLATSDLVTLELLYSARDGRDFDHWADRLSLLQQARVTPAVLVAARDAFRELAHRHPLFHRSVTVTDLVTAAAAEEAGMGVLHYDADFDTLATALSFESRWLAPRGSLD
jgi:predicted nucleic acid-binding protein